MGSSHDGIGSGAQFVEQLLIAGAAEGGEAALARASLPSAVAATFRKTKGRAASAVRRVRAFAFMS